MSLYFIANARIKIIHPQIKYYDNHSIKSKSPPSYLVWYQKKEISIYMLSLF